MFYQKAQVLWNKNTLSNYFIVYSISRYYQKESCRLEWIDCHPSLHHLQLSENCLVMRLSCRQCQWFRDTAAKFPSRMSLVSNLLLQSLMLHYH